MSRRSRRYQDPPPLPPTSQDGAQYAGMRRTHRDTSGNVIGGYTPDGQALGSKQRQGRAGFGYRTEVETPGLDRLAAMQPGARKKPFDAGNGITEAATGDLLTKRQALFASMEKAGANGLTDEMRQQARALQVTDSGFNQAAERIKRNAAVVAPMNGIGNTPPVVTVPPAPAGLNATPPYVRPGAPTAVVPPVAASPVPAPPAPVPPVAAWGQATALPPSRTTPMATTAPAPIAGAVKPATAQKPVVPTPPAPAPVVPPTAAADPLKKQRSWAMP